MTLTDETPGAVATDEAQVLALCQQLLDELPPGETDRTTFLGRQVDPMLESPAAPPTLNDATLLETALTAYRLQSNSPLRNAGLNLWTRFGINPGARDFYNTPLPTTQEAATSFLYDVGAHELA